MSQKRRLEKPANGFPTGQFIKVVAHWTHHHCGQSTCQYGSDCNYRRLMSNCSATDTLIKVMFRNLPKLIPYVGDPHNSYHVGKMMDCLKGSTNRECVQLYNCLLPRVPSAPNNTEVLKKRAMEHEDNAIYWREKYRELKYRWTKCENENKRLREEVDELNGEVDELDEEVVVLNTQADDCMAMVANQFETNTKLLIENERIKEAVHSLAQSL